ncbi:arginine--tRNA ligase [Pleionea sediminis]|uniref:arginine--tRNA ligase n=1 Tax=Pleionea sediminis TaxID=2569479 RepID=UPI0011872BAF|nr:arginine--tRNA ligase [Pleionea sediminis]
MKDTLLQLLEQAILKMKSDGLLTEDFTPRLQVTHTKDKAHGDLATNLAMMLSKQVGKPPRDIAQIIIDALPESAAITKVEIAGPGFINFFMAQDAQSAVISEVLKAKDTFGHNQTGNGQKVQVEFVSANPTGPLHIGHGRGAAVGDSICRLLEANGWDVTAEFYYNDAGQQINNLALSVQARCKDISPDDVAWQKDWYQGDYIKDVADDYMAKVKIDAEDQHVIGKGDPDDLEAIRHFAVAYLRREQDLDLKAFAVHFDNYFLESSLYETGKVEEAVKQLVDNGFTYEDGGALWLKTTEFGDDKDRVMRKKDGGYTYFVPDVAYHLNKYQRGFKKVINEQGADHHSTITRVRAGLQALKMDIPQGYPDYVLHQMVTVMRGGEEVKISKRAGSYVTLRDLIDEVGRDATRYFLAARRAESQLTFDIELAKSQTNDNPVYYIQYAHARVCSAFRKLSEVGKSFDQTNGLSQLELLTLEQETDLMDKMSQFPELVKSAASQCEPHVIAHYLRDLAALLHGYYQIGSDDANNRWIVDDRNLCDARLTLITAVKQVISNGLHLLGVSAPEKM